MNDRGMYQPVATSTLFSCLFIFMSVPIEI